MTIDFDGLRNNLLDSYENIVTQLNKSHLKPDGFMEVDAQRLEKNLDSLRDDIVFLLGIINPETGASLLDDEDFVVASFEVPFDNGY